jgi:hypothetical protein
VNPIESARTQIDAVDGLAEVFGAAWDAFEVIQLVANTYADQVTDQYAMWMYAIPPACDGKDALGFAPSTPGGSVPAARLGDLGALTEDQSADALAGLADAVAAKLGVLDGRASTPKDALACTRAIGAARQIRKLLAENG